MTPAEAFAALGLTPGAAPADVRAAYRERAKAIHPDRGEQSADYFTALVRARTIARNYALEEPCPSCGGSGKTTSGSPAWTPLTFACGNCNGSGKRYN